MNRIVFFMYSKNSQSCSSCSSYQKNLRGFSASQREVENCRVGLLIGPHRLIHLQFSTKRFDPLTGLISYGYRFYLPDMDVGRPVIRWAKPVASTCMPLSAIIRSIGGSVGIKFMGSCTREARLG